GASDPMIGRQWALRAIGWFARAPLPDARGIKVGVLDTGVDITHPELQNMVQSYVHEGSSAVDVVGHGTHVCGILSAETNNGIGIAGVSQSDLNVWKIFDDTPDHHDGEYYVNEVMYQRALNAARSTGMSVVNLSIGGTAKSQTEEILFRRLANAGVTVVAAMGNEFEEGNPTEYPAKYPGVFAVGAVGRKLERARFSNTGSHIGLCAPGVNIISTLPLVPSAARKKSETQYAEWSGTSMATPHVSAAAALVIAANPNFTPTQVSNKLKSGAVKVAAMKGKSSTPEYGSGLLNLPGTLS
ncbi:MAG TPA: S8 family serine peptidase, partial [Blastocatellia bacterium]|nr:S8 family serine peptidase [Blastocatellia bacterium]